MGNIQLVCSLNSLVNSINKSECVEKCLIEVRIEKE